MNKEDSIRSVHIAMANYPTRVPVWIERAEDTVEDMDRHKFLIEKDMTMAQVCYIIRNRIKLESHYALFILVGNGVLPPSSALVGHVYNEHVADDGMLHVKYRLEKTFG